MVFFLVYDFFFLLNFGLVSFRFAFVFIGLVQLLDQFQSYKSPVSFGFCFQMFTVRVCVCANCSDLEKMIFIRLVFPVHFVVVHISFRMNAPENTDRFGTINIFWNYALRHTANALIHIHSICLVSGSIFYVTSSIFFFDKSHSSSFQSTFHAVYINVSYSAE